MIEELSIHDLYTAIAEDPDLRRLGPYKLVADDGQTIFPIDIDLGDRQLHLGAGDFTDGFVAFANTRAQAVDLGTAQFTDVYLDGLATNELHFASSRASRVYFDTATIAECRFGDLTVPEIYFDTAKIDSIDGENLQAGIIYVQDSDHESENIEGLASHAHRFTRGKAVAPHEETASEDDIRVITEAEFLSRLAEDGDLRRLGRYRVEPEIDNTDGKTEIILDATDGEFNFGAGDFTSLEVSFGSSRAKLIDFGTSRFTDVDMGNAEVKECFFAESRFRHVGFGEAQINTVFVENGSAQSVNLADMTAEHFNINNLYAAEFRFGRSHIKEMYLSEGEGVQRMYGEQAELGLLNLHEGRLDEVDFGYARIEKALINKAHIERVNAEGLRADKLYIGNDGRNEIGQLDLGAGYGIRLIDLEKTGRPNPEGKEGRRVISEIGGEIGEEIRRRNDGEH